MTSPDTRTPQACHEIKEDALFNGELVLAQHKSGYRFGSDSLLLATDLPEICDDATIVELGAAHGPVALTIAARMPKARVIAIERQESLFSLLQLNIARNNLENVEAIHADIREHRNFLTAHCAQLVVCNPPYFREGQRRPSTNVERAQARHELHGTLKDFIDAARYALTHRGWLKMIIPPLRIFDMKEAIHETDLHLHSLRFFHSSPTNEAYLVEACLRRGGAPDFRVHPPLIICHDDGTYSDEVAQRLGSQS